MLGVDRAVLEAMLTQRVVVTRGEVFTINLGVQDADLTRDAIVKSLYEVRLLVQCVYGRQGVRQVVSYVAMVYYEAIDASVGLPPPPPLSSTKMMSNETRWSVRRFCLAMSIRALLGGEKVEAKR